MNFGTLTYIFTIASIFFLSCSYDQDITTEKNTQVLPEKAILTPEEYIDWSSQPNNLLIKEKTISEFNYKIKYLPTGY